MNKRTYMVLLRKMVCRLVSIHSHYYQSGQSEFLRLLNLIHRVSTRAYLCAHIAFSSHGRCDVLAENETIECYGQSIYRSIFYVYEFSQFPIESEIHLECAGAQSTNYFNLTSRLALYANERRLWINWSLNIVMRWQVLKTVRCVRWTRKRINRRIYTRRKAWWWH